MSSATSCHLFRGGADRIVYRWVLAALCVASWCGIARAADPVEIPVDPKKTFVYTPAAMEFPPRLATLTRAVIYRYDEKGRDVSIGYNDVIDLVAATVYLYPTNGVPLDHHYRTVKGDVTAAHPDAVVISQAKWLLAQENGSNLEGVKAVFGFTSEFAGVPRSLLSEAYLLKLGDCYLLVRITYPSDRQRDELPLVARFLASLKIHPPKPPTTGPAAPATKPAAPATKPTSPTARPAAH